MAIVTSFLYVYQRDMITNPLRRFFTGGPYQNVRYIFWDPPLDVKLVAERPPGIVFAGRICPKYLQKHLEKCSLHFGSVLAP